MIILCSIKPFMYAQKIMVFNDDGDAYTTITTTVKDFAENLCRILLIAPRFLLKSIKMRNWVKNKTRIWCLILASRKGVESPTFRLGAKRSF